MWLHLCRHALCCPVMPMSGGGGGSGGRRKRLTIDLHCHTMSLAAEQLVADAPQKRAEPELTLKSMGPASAEHNRKVMFPQALPKLTRLEQRLADMDAMGVDVQLVSASPGQYYYWADEPLARQLVTLINDEVAAMCARHPDRIAGLGSVALQHPQLACEQLEHAVKTLGLKGVVISTSVNGRELSHPSLTPFWDKAEALGALVFIHPLGSTLGERANTHYLVNTIGQPLETTLALSHLIFGGVLDRYPKLKILAAHGGGYLPTAIGRSNHAFTVRPEAAAQAQTAPGELLKRIWFDTIVYDPMALRHLIERVGVGQVVVGTDYPYDMGHYDVHALVDATTGLSEADRDAVLGGNAAALIGWPA